MAFSHRFLQFVSLFGLIWMSKASFHFESLVTGGGNLDNLNVILNLLTLNLNLNIEPKPIIYPVGNRNVLLEAVIGEKGLCNDLLINPGGDISVTGKFLDEKMIVDGFDEPLSAYEVEISVEVLQFECTVPLKVTVEGFLNFVNTVDGFGNLTFRSETATLSQKILAFSPDFENSPSVFAIAGECNAQPDVLTYFGDNLGEIANVDITGIVIEELESDPSYVFNDVQIELCKLGTQLGTLIAGLFVNEELTNTSSSFYLDDPFLPDGNGVISALESEQRLYEEFSEDVDGLLNLAYDDNFFIDLVIAESNNDTSILNDILELIVDSTGESDVDPVILLLADLFDIPVEPDGSLLDIDLLKLLFEDGLEISFNASLVENVLFVEGKISLVSVLLGIVPPVAPEPGVQPPYILPPFLAFSNQTVLLDGINLEEITASARLGIDLKLENLGLPGNDFLQEPFLIAFNEILALNLAWEGFIASLGILFAVNVDYLLETEIGPLADNLIDCILAIFPLAPVITGATLGHDLLGISFTELEDSILILVADVVQVLLPAFKPVIPRAIELLIAGIITDVQFFDETECATEDPNSEFVPFDFSKGLLKDVKELLTADTLNNLLGGLSIVDNGLYFVGYPSGFNPNDLGTGFEIEVPEIDGWRQNITIYLQGFNFQNFLPPFLRELDLFRVLEDSEYYPQYLRSVINVGTVGDPVGIQALFNITASEPEIDPDVDPENVSPNPPSVFRKQENFLNVTWFTDAADVLLDLHLTYSKLDVRGSSIRELLNVGCWGSKIEFPGGIALLSAAIEQIDIHANCVDCDNEVVLEWKDNFLDPTTNEDQLVFLNEFLNRFGLLMVRLFDVDRYEKTIETSQLICDKNDYGLIGSLIDYEVLKIKGDFFILLPFVAFFFFAIVTPCLVGCWLNNYGPELNKIKKHHVNNEINKKLLSDARISADVTILERAKNLEQPMYRNPLISTTAKRLFPFALFINVILFLIGDTGDAVRIDIIGQFFLIPFQADNFRALSVISSVIELFKTGGWLLGLLLFTLSILWPYVKLFLMALCWGLPITKMSISTRGKLIEFLDFFGRFSFAEFHFLVFVLVVFQLEASSPRNSFLPDRDMFSLTLDLEPLLSLFMFCLAVVVSIVLSNIMLVLQHNIEDETRIREREEELENRSDAESDEILALDSKSIRLTSWCFRVDEEDEENKIHYVYKYKITRKAIITLASIVVCASGCLLAASFISSLRVEIYGFFAYLIQFSGGDKEFEISVYGLLYEAINRYSENYIVYFIGIIFICTIVIIPVVQTILLLVLLFKSVTLKQARRLTEAHHVMSVWCCIDVFIIAITLTVLELPTVASGLAGELDFCEDVGEAMFIFFEPMGYVSVDDVNAGCIGMKSYVTEGAYVAVLSVFILNIANFFVSRMFYSFIADREKVTVQHSLHPDYDSAGIRSFHSWLNRWGFITLVSPGESMLKGSQANPMYSEYEEKMNSRASNLSHSKKKSKRKKSKVASSFGPQKNPFFNVDDKQL